MGWQSKIIYLVENIESEQLAINLAHELFEYEGKFFHWFSYGCYIGINNNGLWTLFYFYEKRKTPYYKPVIYLSKFYKEANFTVLVCPESWIGDPASVLRLKDGLVYDFYGINSMSSTQNRYKILEKPQRFNTLIYNHFKLGSDEENLRLNFPKLQQFDINSIDERDNLLPIKDSNYLKTTFSESQKFELDENKGWKKYEGLKSIPTPEEYLQKYAAIPSNQIEISEKSLTAAITYNPLITGWENELAEEFEWALKELNKPFSWHFLKTFKEKGIYTIKDLEVALENNLDNVFEHFRPHKMRNNSTWRFRGFTVNLLYRFF